MNKKKRNRAEKPKSKGQIPAVAAVASGSLSEKNKKLRLELKFALAALKSFNDAFDAQPWATDEPARVQLNAITERLRMAESSANDVHEPQARQKTPDKSSQ